MAREHNCVGGAPSKEPSWWFKDGRGIELFRGCEKCAPEKRKRYRPEILKPYDQSDVNEPIEPEE
jgi:hypothetical protein